MHNDNKQKCFLIKQKIYDPKKCNAPLEPGHGAAVLRIEALAHPKAATIPGHAIDPASTSKRHHHLKNQLPL